MIPWLRGLAIAACAWLLCGPASAQTASGGQPRFALVIGEGAYSNAAATPETTAVNDAGLIAYQLQQAGFDVTGGRDVDRAGFESLAATFIAKLGQAGPNAVAVIYVSGIGLQSSGDNRIVPTDAALASLDAIGAETISINELLALLQTIPGAAHVAIFDIARPLPFRIAPQVAPGLAALDAQQGLLVAFSQQPGYVLEEQKQGYGAYASALADAIRVPGLSLDELFARVRLRAQSDTKGGQLPWNVSGLVSDFTFFTPQTPVAPPPAAAAMRSRPLAQLSVGDAFALAIERDTIDGYREFVAAFPDGPLARRARAIIAARREAFFWRRTVTRGTPEAYWTYLLHYPRGPHAEEAQIQLSSLNEPYSPPATFYEEDYDIPPPPPEEVTDE
ncbi:MAG: caspase domain-containing protein, partial [Hyphomicrobiales bacterium]